MSFLFRNIFKVLIFVYRLYHLYTFLKNSRWGRQRCYCHIFSLLLPTSQRFNALRHVRKTLKNINRKNQAIGCGYSRCIQKVKEVIQPQVPLRLPCYDFIPVMNHTVVTVLPKVKLATSGATHSHDVTGGVYKARERIHRDMLIRDY